ncbi:ATP-dependent DNA helicase RecQ [Burkholderiales bacterium 8X]|nr:ATP-dependent DNA helicase RecQ [Burkholderiales bacterium 8X]
MPKSAVGPKPATEGDSKRGSRSKPDASPLAADRAKERDKVLREVFGHRRLRAGQQRVIDRVLSGQSTLAVMPTGAGKSLCYQLPSVLMGGLTVVVSPLIALMKDQCEKLQRLGVNAVQFNSQVAAEDIHAAEKALVDGSARIVLTTPERLADAAFMKLLQERPPNLMVVDEAHCISQWGHDFRPAFLDIGPAVEALGSPVLLALTATANDEVAQDIMKRLAIPASGLIDTGTFRSNLHYAVEQMASEEEKLERALMLVQNTAGSGIVYAATIKAAEAVHAALLEANVSVGLYHGKRGAADRAAVQEAFMTGEVRVMVATNAFGMGIDKPDIRFVLHYQMPSGLDAYYQESGRAGRDGEVSKCTLLFRQRDKAVQQFFLAGRYPEIKDLDALYRALHSEPPEVESGKSIDEVGDGAGDEQHDVDRVDRVDRGDRVDRAEPLKAGTRAWSLAALQDRLDVPRSKVHVALALLVQQRIVSRSRDGRLKLLRPELAADALEAMVETYKERREHDRATLERMVFYAQTGQCRWQVLLAHLEEETPKARCGTCDNCRRIARHEAALKAPIVVDPNQPVLRKAEPPKMPEPVFSPRDPVKVKRYGAGMVVSADAVSVTIEFADGSRRCFQPQFVQAAGRRNSRAAAASGSDAAAQATSPVALAA